MDMVLTQGAVAAGLLLLDYEDPAYYPASCRGIIRTAHGKTKTLTD